MTAAAAGVTLETNSSDGERVVSRGFARAMDAFEDSLRIAADAELGSAGTGAASRPQQQQQQAARGGGAAAATVKSTSSASGSSKSGATAKAKSLYRPVARGLGVRERQPPAWHGEAGMERGTRRRGSLSCLSVCARKPLLAAIARGGAGLSSVGGVGDEEKSGSDGTAENDESPRERQRRQRQRHPATGRPTTAGVEIQIWNYRTKRALVRHRFGSDLPSLGGGGGGDGGGGGSIELLGSVIDGGGTGGGGGGGMGADGGDGGAGGGDGGDVTCPVALSLHPSGDSIAVAFPDYVNVFYIVGGGGETAGGRRGSGGEGVADAAASKDSLSMSLKQFGVAEEMAAAETTPLATLRSDQREFLTKGMFSVSGEQEPVINCDPVSAVHYSPGGHLLAVVTGKVNQREHAAVPREQQIYKSKRRMMPLL